MAKRLKNPEVEKLRSDRPREGVWYYVWLKPRWKLVGAFNTSHLELWNKEVVPVIGKHYRLSADARKDLETAHKSMPRGRVGIRSSVWFSWHGNDVKQDVLDAVTSGFGLTPLLMKNELTVAFHDHEVMSAEHQCVAMDCIGSIPYDRAREVSRYV